jgi:phospholipase/carboxylesterase
MRAAAASAAVDKRAPGPPTGAMSKIHAMSGPSHPPAAGGDPQQLVILLHGVGADGNDLIGLAPHWGRMLPHAEFLSPNAPFPCDMAPFGYQWFSLSNRAPQAIFDGIRGTAPSLDAFITEAMITRGLGPEQVALVGFSQGTMMALYVAPRRGQPLAALLGYSGALVAPELLAREAMSRPPVLLIHGEADEVVPSQALPAAVQGLKTAGFDVQAHMRPRLGHGIDPEGLMLGGQFLAERFAQSGKEPG